MTNLTKATLLALLLPAALLLGAFASEHIGRLYPCEMCHWQRWPHEMAIAIMIVALFIRPVAQRPLISLAALAIFASGLIGVFHAGVEYDWWEGLTRCATSGGGGLADIMKTPLVRCDTAPWTLASVSLAGFNAIFSIAGMVLILVWLRKP